MNKSLNILFFYIKKDKPTIFPNLNAIFVRFSRYRLNYAITNNGDLQMKKRFTA